MNLFNRLAFFTLGASILVTPFGPLRNSSAAVGLVELEQFWEGATKTVEDFTPLLAWELLAKAEPDECFFGIGDERNSYDPGLELPCPEGATAKVNQAYVWGLAKSGDNIWFGTVSNVHCLVIGSYLGVISPSAYTPWVCEFGQGRFQSGLLPEFIRDWRPPRLFVYDTGTGTLTEKTDDLDGLDAVRLQTTVGIRSAGTQGDVVFLGGPALSLSGGIHLFAFNTRDGSFLGSTLMSEYSNIRKWLVVNDVLYTAVGFAQESESGGKVLRWTGTAQDPFQFEVVGNLDTSGAELAFHEDRLFVSTWPGGGEISSGLAEVSHQAGVWMSPPVPEGGLTPADADSFVKIWQTDDYEPDPVTALTYGGGAIASFDGHLYWGTMHVPFLSLLAHRTAYYDLPGYPKGDEYPDVWETIFYGTLRPIAIFRGRNFGSGTPDIELVYGETRLPRFTYDPGTESGQWEIVDNNMGGAEPLSGHSGFGNPLNNYTWTMAVYKDQLFVGTMDWSYLLSIYLGTSFANPGADLYRFPSAEEPAAPESIDGVSNLLNYGIRTMIAEKDALYLGMANPMNLATDSNDVLPQGGWELVKLTGGDSGDDGLCFIATAAHGSPFAPHVRILRRFRDRFLVTNRIGRTLVKLYASGSPPIADFISRHPGLRALFRIGLLPLVGVSWAALNLGTGAAAVFLLLCAAGIIGLALIGKRMIPSPNTEPPSPSEQMRRKPSDR